MTPEQEERLRLLADQLSQREDDVRVVDLCDAALIALAERNVFAAAIRAYAAGAECTAGTRLPDGSGCWCPKDARFTTAEVQDHTIECFTMRNLVHHARGMIADADPGAKMLAITESARKLARSYRAWQQTKNEGWLQDMWDLQRLVEGEGKS